MDATYITALAALAGSGVGGITTFLGSWVGQRAQLESQASLASKLRREELYREFIAEASNLFIDALTHDTPDMSKTIVLYALVSRMRVLSSEKVLVEAEAVVRLIIDLYPQQNKTFEDIRAMAKERAFDPLHAFALSCREELEVRR